MSEFAKPSSCKDIDEIKFSGSFDAPTELVFEAFTKADDIMRYTQAPAASEPVENGKYMIFAGAVIGEFVEVIKNEKIVLKWKFSNWEKGMYSTVTLNFTDFGDTCGVEFTQANIPYYDQFGNHCVPSCKAGWQERIFGGIARFMGYHFKEE
eukprot:TRINITY_DN165615_c0_g1_i1.p1 TRINITY_DN165615_c0_g1~~TRINITY_DN165615_c0_g1_i1.p1  ORF type:complete len:174 (+),score=23.58 TRINITY_DN165615_c0_g1_i1:68-523(+)